MIIINFFRSLIFEIGRWTIMLFFSIIGPFLWPFSYKKRYEVLKHWGWINLWWLKVTCGITHKVHGLEKVDLTKPSIVLAHHESAWETIAIQSFLPRMSFVLKKELLKIPFFGWLLGMLKPIAIDRKAGSTALKQILEQGYDRIYKDLDWVTIFPEGTRVKPNTLGKVNRGGAILAKEVKAPVYLITHNAGSFWAKNAFIRKPGVVDVWISEPLKTEDLTVDEINQEFKNWVISHQFPVKTEQQEVAS